MDVAEARGTTDGTDGSVGLSNGGQRGGPGGRRKHADPSRFGRLGTSGRGVRATVCRSLRLLVHTGPSSRSKRAIPSNFGCCDIEEQLNIIDVPTDADVSDSKCR
eukprot:1176579-Prorocentrum_minimum.AAC.2